MACLFRWACGVESIQCSNPWQDVARQAPDKAPQRRRSPSLRMTAAKQWVCGIRHDDWWPDWNTQREPGPHALYTCKASRQLLVGERSWQSSAKNGLWRCAGWAWDPTPSEEPCVEARALAAVGLESDSGSRTATRLCEGSEERAQQKQ